jgi:hypothetical protein
MCSLNEDHCSHIKVTPEAEGYIRMLQSVARTSCSDHADILLQVCCFLRDSFQVEDRDLPESITQYLRTECA